MKTTYILLFIFFLPGTYFLSVHAQVTVKGLVVDSVKQSPLSFATVAIKKTAGEKPMLSTSTEDAGVFQLRLAPGSYVMELSHVSYASGTKTLQVPEGMTDLDLGKIFLMPVTGKLQAVEVSGKKPVYHFSPGKIIYEVQNDVRAIGKNGFEVLRQAPMVSIQGFESIQLKGRSSFLLQLNGKTFQSLSANPFVFLQSMDQSQIERIEIITNPSAKYTAEGITGIINIITKKQNQPGSFGSITAGYDNYKNASAGLNLYGRKDKLGYSIVSNGSLWRNGTYDYSLFQQIGQSSLSARSTTLPKRNNLNAIASLSYQANQRNVINLDAAYFTGSGKIRQNFLKSASAIETRTELLNRNFSIGADWENKIDSLSSLVISYKLEQQENESRIRYNLPGAIFENQGRSAEHTVQADYKRKHIEAGAKAISRSLRSDNIRDIISNRDFRFVQNVYAAYLSYATSYKSFNLEAGLRGEQAHVSGAANKDSFFLRKDYLQIFPTVSVDRSFEKLKANLSFGYSRRTLRPQLYYLNPFVNTTNPYSFSSGNAVLRPELSNNFELRFTKQDKKNNQHIFNFSFQYARNSIVSVLHPINDTVIAGTFINFPRQQLWGFSYYASIRMFKKLQLGLNNNLYWTKYPRTSIHVGGGNSILETSGFYGSFGLTVSGTVFKKLRWSSSNSFNLREIYLQGYGRSFFYQDFTLIAPLFKNKWMVFGSLRQPFNSRYRFTATYSDLDFFQYAENSTPQRRVFAGFRYAFGKQSKSVSRTRKKIENEDKKSRNTIETIK